MTQDKIIEMVFQAEREAQEAWEKEFEDYHSFSDMLDEDVTRCEKCGANVLWNREYPKCEDYNAYRDERNRKLREAAGL
jgi:hypothetical protein